MRLKQEVQNSNENEEEDDRVCCPVCTNYLRKDVSLHDHLNTHPKQQVIEALIQLKDACKGFNPPASAHSKSSSSGSSSSSANTSDNTTETEATSASTTEESEERDETRNVEEPSSEEHVSPPLPSTSGGHIIEFPQFLARSSSVPPFIHVPAVTSTDPNSVSPRPAQAPLMLYNPFVCPPGTSGQVVVPHSGPLSPTQRLQFIASNSFIRTPFSIVQTRSNLGLSQVSSLVQSLAEENSTGPSSCVTVMSLSQTPNDSDEDTNEEQSSDSDIESIPCSDPLAENDLTEEDCLPEDLAVSPKPKHSASEEAAMVEDCLPTESESELDKNSLPEDDNVEDHGRGMPLDTEMLSPPKKRRCPDWNATGSPGSHSTSSVEGFLRVRSDLSVSSILQDQEDICQDLTKESLKKETSDAHQTTGNFSNVSEATQKQTSNQLSINLLNHAEIDLCNEDSGVRRIDVEGHLIYNLSHAENEFVLPCDDPRDELSSSGPCSPPCDSGPPSPYPKSVDYLDSPATPLNIQTDEKMPPRGELSEQESIGGNSSSMWSVPLYHTSRELPSPVVSYDLTARESWPGSDISDSEGNANLVPDSHLPQQFSTAPSFSNTLHSFIPKNPCNSSFVGESPFSSHIQPQTPTESPSSTKISCSNPTSSKAMTNKSTVKKSNNDNATTTRVRKAPAKPRVYRCKECASVFPTLKLRRLHPCEQMINSNKNTNNAASMSLSSDGKVVSEDNQIPGSSSRDELGTQPKPKKKYQRKPKATIKREVVVEDQSSGQASFGAQFPVSKSEPDDSAESRLISQTSSDTPASVAYQSSSCDAAASSMTYVEVTLKHESSQPSFDNQCQKCSQTFTSAKLMFQHLSSKHRGQKYQCATCGECFEKERGYFDHLMIHPLECQLCGKTFKRRKSLNLHMKWHLDVKPHKCESCNKSFVTKQKLDEHMNTHTGNAPIKCNVCEETFKRYSNLIQHKNRHHLNLKRKTRDYICHCGEVCQSKKKLEWHKEIHDDKPKSCHYCCEKFVHTVSLTRHIRKAHDRRYVPKKGREGENIECPVCHLVFLKSSLATHIKIHSGERPYSCHICGKDFSTKWNLQLHRWTHASRSSKPFKCTLCKAAFFRKQEYQGHMHSHRNVRPFTCNHCGCQFIRKYNCLRHMREHEEGKNFTCTICNKTFHRSYYLKDHMRVHSGARPFSCHICGKASTSKSNHNKHVRIHHAREPQNTEV